ncbi:MAG TPA: hypothetical protein VK539_40545 [Myxococcaceae bacterium]|nr:hypothetical protein [Myxococcaceae bacterium]
MNCLRSRGMTLAGLTLSTLLVLGCEPPAVVPTEDQTQKTVTARIEGNVVVQGPARGNAVVFLYDALRPPPPKGTGRPVSFTIVPMEDIFRSDLDGTTNGPFTAPFTFPLVPPGRYLLRGFIDTDTCRAGAQPCHGPDFIPWFNVTAEPNLGDVGGAAVDASTLLPQEVEVSVKSGVPQPVLGVSVSFSSTALVRADRPAFEVLSPSRFEPGTPNKLLRLRVRPISDGVVDLRSPIFLVRFVDENPRDGRPDDANRDGVPDLWPRVVVRKLAENSLTDENDLDNNGVLDETGVDYPHANAPQDGEPDLVVLASGVVPDAFLPALTDAQGNPRMDAVVPTPELSVAVRALAFDARNPDAPEPLRTVPPGRYAVIVIQSTGQVWRVPNELTPGVAEPRGLPSLESQSFVVEVP